MMDFSKAYEREEFIKFLQNEFLPENDFKTEESEMEIRQETKYIKAITRLGTCPSLKLAVYEAQHTSTNDARVGLSKEIFRFMANKRERKALVLFVPECSAANYRLSLISIELNETETGGVKRTYSNPRRYSYYLGEGIACYTPNKYLNAAGRVKDAKDLTERFSVEVLTKAFYQELSDWYQWAVDGSSNVTFPNYTTTEEDDRDDIEKKIIRMITRIMFVWFIKQKDLVPSRIFDKEFLSTILKDFDPYSTTEGNYYNAILQNLFFGTLNRAINDEDGNTRKFATSSKRDIKTLYRYAELFSISEQEVINLFAEVPFMNGGLFECLDKTRYIDGVEQCYNFDGFSRNSNRFADGRFKHRAVVPNNLFFEPEKGLISILSRYNFTIEENSPEEQQVALDPELLGKVFENLLGAYNPETKETARNQSGSFYTPREIVNYMVDESLIAYLGDGELIRSIFSNNFMFDKSKIDEYKRIADKLKAVKVLDPACGSGAFPMGLLNRMIDVLERISPDESIYDLKLYIIENCLYGSDIQSIAAQITKLRFFISLICDCEKDVSKPNFGIPTLPNLETKFVSANSLIAKKERAAQGILFENPEIEATKEELHQIRHQHFSAKSASTKHRLREKDQALREKLAKLLSDDNNFAPEDAKQLAAWNPYDQNAVSPFFDPNWMFGVEDGFDIVIGNPPYISTKGVKDEDKKSYEKEFGFSDDTYNLFTFKGLSLCKRGGSLSYIMPKTFWTTQTKRNMRDLILNNQINYIFDTANPFDAVMVDTCIIQVIKQPMPKDHKIKFLDGTKDLLNPMTFAPVEQSIYMNSQNSVIFKPTALNLRIYELYGQKVKELYDKWWDKIETSKKIAKHQKELEAYRASLKPGDIALLGCLTEGGQGLATANNGKYIAVRRSTKWAKNIIDSRPKKLAEAIRKNKIKLPQMEGYANERDFLDSLSDKEIALLFDELKEKYGRDIFGQGYIYKIIDDSELANVDSLTQEEKENGIDTTKNYYVPYDKGDKDGNRWYLETPFAIAWSKENVHFLKTDPKARYQGYSFYFREGFRWSAINGTRSTNDLKFCYKSKTVNDVQGMSLSCATDSITSQYITAICNADFMSRYTEAFINSTVIFQINDCRQIPIIIPRKSDLDLFTSIFEEAKQIVIGDNSHNKLEEIKSRLDEAVIKLYNL